MSPRRRITLVGCSLGALLVAVLVWQLLSVPARPRGGVLISFVGFTNSASGAVAQFTFSNAFPHRIVCATGAVQIRQPKGWPGVFDYGYPVGLVFTVDPNTAQTFAAAVPELEGAVWRVPLTYQQVGAGLDWWTEHVRDALNRAAPKPWMYTNTPEMVGWSNSTLQRPGLTLF